MRTLAQELLDLLLSSRSKKDIEAENKLNNDTSKPNFTPPVEIFESPKQKRDKEILFKQIETKLFDAYDKAKDPFWLNILLIENSKDYTYNKYNSLACLMAKYFETWVFLPANSQLVSSYQFTKDLKISAFIVTCKYHLMMVDSIFKAYQIYKDNEYLLPFLKFKLGKLDFKDKAILISSTMLHDHFSFEEV